MAQRKRMTGKEKAERARIKKELQEKGVIPPNKPRLNRKRFVDEAMKEWDNRKPSDLWGYYLRSACGVVVTKTEGRGFRVSQEAVGAAKVLKIAKRLYEFDMLLASEGRTEYKVSEQFEYIRDILDA